MKQKLESLKNEKETVTTNFSNKVDNLQKKITNISELSEQRKTDLTNEKLKMKKILTEKRQ